MAQASEHCRRERILDAAEHAFAESGFAGASLRDIVREARVNLATVYYYFGSKDGLMEAVLKRRFGPLRAEHLEMLRQFEAKAGGGALPPEKILEAMLLPPLRVAAAAPAKRHAVTRLMGRILTDPNPRIQAILRSQRAEVLGAFLKAWKASLPGVGGPDLEWRMQLTWGALATILCNPAKFERQSGASRDLSETEAVLAEMVSFFAPGFRQRGPRRRPVTAATCRAEK